MTLNSDIEQLTRSIQSGIKFDLGRIKEIFDESRIAISGELAKSYGELVDFNKKMTKERNAALRAQVKELEARRDTLSVEHQRGDAERQRLLQIIKNADTFRKYKALQAEQSEKRVHADLPQIPSFARSMSLRKWREKCAIYERRRMIRSLPLR